MPVRSLTSPSRIGRHRTALLCATIEILTDLHLDDLRAEIQRLLAQPADLRDGLERLLAHVEGLAGAVDALQRTRAREEAQIGEVLEVLTSLAALDFRLRARVHGDGPLDALAQVANMLSEELEATQREMAAAWASAESATIAKSRFLTHMSHEIRTPLTALLGFADLLLQPKLTESERLNYALIIRRNGEHLLQVINDILDLSRVEAGRLSIERISCVPAWILSDVASLMRVRAKENGLEFEARLVTPIPRFVHSDPTRLRQILLNLVGNAIKFTRKGVVRLLARADGARLVVEVVDTGIGIAPEQLQLLFQPFTQADLSLTRRFGGSGLGLAISKALAEALGGDISVESEVGRGSTFRLSLPFDPGGETVDSLEEMPSDRPAPLASATRLAGNVLVVEDGVDNQVLITTLLRGYGATVAVTGDGQVAVQRALDAWRNGTPFDLILMDMQMPVMDGYKATASLRAAGYPKPIVALTAHAMAGERERCLEAGCDDYVRKPIGRSELLAVLEKYLSAAPGSAEQAPLHSTFAADPDMAEIIERFVAQLPQRIAALRAEAREPRSEALQRLVHQLKGAAGGYGFEPVSEAAAALETAVKSGGTQAQVQQALDDLAEVCGRARAGTP